MSVPVQRWDDFAPRFRWAQGEHVAFIGATGRGKTTLGMRLMAWRKAAVVWSVKPSDPTVDRWIAPKSRFRRGQPTEERPFTLIDRWPPARGELKVVLRPSAASMREKLDVRREVLHECADAIMDPRVGHWCVFADDAYYLCDILGNPVRDDLIELWAMGRSHGVSLVAGVQRSAYIPVIAYQSSTHLFFWREVDERNLDRISEIGIEDKALVRRIVRRLDANRRQVLYVNTFSGQLAVIDLSTM